MSIFPIALLTAAAWADAAATGTVAQEDPPPPAVWQPPHDLTQIPLWPHGAPNPLPDPKPESMFAVRKVPDRHYTAIVDVSVPTITVFPAKGTNTGAAIVVFPGGGFNLLAIDLEGTEICEWITARGIACVLLKYRVPGSNEHWNHDCRCRIDPPVATSLQDAQRAIVLVRARAGELGIDPKRIGVIGFSAGGYLVAQTSNAATAIYPRVDAADDVSARPDFAIALYPGHLCREGGVLDPGLAVSPATPPTFLLHAEDDPVDDICESTVYAQALQAAGVPVEFHHPPRGGHAFGLRKADPAVMGWPRLVEAWLAQIGVLAPAPRVDEGGDDAAR